jgi:hypothetical protein
MIILQQAHVTKEASVSYNDPLNQDEYYSGKKLNGLSCRGSTLGNMLMVINAGNSRNSATEQKFPRLVLTRKFDFESPIRRVMKDPA